MPLYSPSRPSFLTVFTTTSDMPEYFSELGRPCACSLVRTRAKGYIESGQREEKRKKQKIEDKEMKVKDEEKRKK